MGIIKSLMNIFSPEKKRVNKIKPRSSPWYKYPFIPNWAYNFGPPQNTIEDKISDLRLRNGTYYKIITRGRAYKIIIKRNRNIQKNYSRRKKNFILSL